MCVCIQTAHTFVVYKHTIFLNVVHISGCMPDAYARVVCVTGMRKSKQGATRKDGPFACTLGISQCMTLYAKYVEPVQEPVLPTDSN